MMPLMAAMPEVDKNKASGNPNAPLQVEVFTSFDCPHCKALHMMTIPLLEKDYVATGKMYIIYREFPLSGPYHPYAREAATYAVAAARIGKYNQVANAFWDKQAEWAPPGPERKIAVWDVVAGVLNPADQKKVQQLAKDPSVIAEVDREYQEGVTAGVSATPTLIANRGAKRYPIPSTDLEYSILKSLLDGMLK